MRFSFEAELWRWTARRELWTFVSLPEDASAEIGDLADTLPRAGFGAVKVSARIGATLWRSSVFPGDGGRYALPVSAAVRRAQALELGDRVRVDVEVLGAD